MLNLIDAIRRYRRERYFANLLRNGLVLGRDVQINDGVFIDPSHCFLITIKDRCVLAPCVRLIAHDASMFRFMGITRVGRITIERNCFIGDSTLVLPGVRIGPDSIVGAGAVVVGDIPPHSVAAGNPAKVICSLEDFLAKHRAVKERSRTFHEDEYSLLRITGEKKKDMLDYLEKNIGYMEGEIPAE
ncbi:MAG TPA: acyltransferase [Nitrospiria bacterium]|nr:acyltransferase [Nitrospiria bacterium]HUK55078.1 acyltransferase [Nitrospiria bacterium]